MMTSQPLLLVACFVLTASVAADETEVISYEQQIKPIFRQLCVACHGEDKQTADLNLQTYGAVLKGGSGGEAVVAGRSSQSALFKAITDPDDDVRMPPKKPPIPKEQTELIQNKKLTQQTLSVSDAC